MNLVLTSDFPSTMNHAVVKRIQALGPSPRVAWVPPLAAVGGERFLAAQTVFRAFGIEHLEYGAALFFTDGEETCFGKGVRFRRGVRRGIEGD